MANDKQAKVPFYIGAKQRLVDDSLMNGGKLNPFSPDTTSNIQLRKVGLTMGLLLRITVTATLGAGVPVLNEEGLYSLIKRMQVIIGNQNAQPIDLDAAGLKAVQRNFGHYGFAGFDVPAKGKVITNPNLYNAPIVASAANSWVFTCWIPFSANMHKDRHLGVLPTSSRGFTANLVIDWEKTANIISGVTCAFSNSTVELQAYTLDTPDYSQVERPSFFVISRKSTKEGSVLNGANVKEILQGGRVLALSSILRVNGSRSNEIDRINIRLAGSNMPLEQRLWQNQADYERRTGCSLGAGEWNMNFMDSFNEGFSGLPRDTIDTGSVGLTEIVTTVNSAGLGANPSLNTIEYVQTTLHAINVSQETENAAA